MQACFCKSDCRNTVSSNLLNLIFLTFYFSGFTFSNNVSRCLYRLNTLGIMLTWYTCNRRSCLFKIHSENVMANDRKAVHRRLWEWWLLHAPWHQQFNGRFESQDGNQFSNAAVPQGKDSWFCWECTYHHQSSLSSSPVFLYTLLVGTSHTE